MQVILRKRIENLGGPGETVTVKDGYARNFLIPKQLALPATAGNLKRVEQEKRRLAMSEARELSAARDMAAAFEGLQLTFTKKAGVEGVLYGSVTPAEISEALEAKGLEADRRRLILAEPIKRVGEYELSLRLHPEVVVPFKVIVHGEEAEGAPATLEQQLAEEEALEQAARAQAQAKALQPSVEDTDGEPQSEPAAEPEPEG